MTGPIIPAELWPEGAHLHTWDSNGLGNWLRPSYGAWHLWASDIPLPPGHDWRVPVMRQQSPAIDLERLPRYSHAASYDEKAGIAGSYMFRDAAGEWVRYDRLLALIGEQVCPIQAAGVYELSGCSACGELHCCGGNDETPRDHCMDCSVHPGKPTKGEGVADGR